MAGTWLNFKAKLHFQKVYDDFPTTFEEKFGETDWVSSKEKMAAVYREIGDTFCEWINILKNRDPHKGVSPNHPIPEILKLEWRIYSRYGKLLKQDEITEIKPGDPPVAFMTPLPIKVDECLRNYHKARGDN